jgi:hypothetical protein
MAETRPAEKSEVIRRLIRLFEAMNVDEALTMFTEDARHRFGNSPPTVGREEMRTAATASHLEAIKGYRFNIQGLWEFGDVVVCEMEIDYIRVDDSTLTLPCTDVFRMEGNRVKDMRISIWIPRRSLPESAGAASSGPPQGRPHQIDVLCQAIYSWDGTMTLRRLQTERQTTSGRLSCSMCRASLTPTRGRA